MSDKAAVAELPSEEDDLERGRPFLALYEHWERNQWSPLDLDLTTDAESFDAFEETQQEGFMWIFAHRFHAEFKVATLLAPFLQHAPFWEMELVIATQIADEHRHLQSVLRVYDEVFSVRGIDNVQALADSHMDPIASTLYDELEGFVDRLGESGAYEDYLAAVLAYHLIAEGVVARTAQNLAGDQFRSFGNFPGLSHGQRLVARDEARHIGIGVQYARRCLDQDGERAEAVVHQMVEKMASLSTSLFEKALAEDMDQQVLDGYGVDADGFYAEAMRLWDLRMRSIGFFRD